MPNKKTAQAQAAVSLVEKKKIRSDKVAHGCSFGLSIFFSLFFICLIAFIVYASVPGFQQFGFSNILLTGQFDLNQGKASVWLPLCVTILSAGIAILIAAPIGIKTAVFIKYRCSKRVRKPLRVGVEILADIPSVLFGLFATNALGWLIGLIFGTSASYSVITTAIMQTFMILPSVVSMTMNALDGVDSSLMLNALAIGNTKTRAIYKICKKECKNGIVVGVVIAIARAIGETMAVGMILQSQQYNNTFDTGFWAVLTSGLRSLGALISANMFSAGGALQGLLFTFGIVMFIFVVILNGLAMSMTKKKNREKYTRAAYAMDKVGEFVTFIPRMIKVGWEKMTYPHKIKDGNYADFIVKRAEKNKTIKFYDGWKLFWEWFSIIVVGAFLVWIVGDLLVNGIFAFAGGNTTLFSIAKNTTGQAFINTLIIVVIAIAIGFPIAFFIAIFLSEFVKEGKAKKTLLFFIDSLGSTPSILFGMFGLIFFIQKLGMTSQGAAGKSRIAGILTILIVILPTFIRTINQSLASVPKELRINSYALGAGKWETVRKVVLPLAMQGVMSSIVLSIGRILAETAPLYLTSGLSSSASISLLSEGQTLTTRIYAQIYESGVVKGNSIMYECALVTMILIAIILIILHVIIPLYFKQRKKKQDMTDAAIKQMTEKKQQQQNEIYGQINFNEINLKPIIPKFNVNSFAYHYRQRLRF